MNTHNPRAISLDVQDVKVQHCKKQFTFTFEEAQMEKVRGSKASFPLQIGVFCQQQIQMNNEALSLRFRHFMLSGVQLRFERINRNAYIYFIKIDLNYTLDNSYVNEKNICCLVHKEFSLSPSAGHNTIFIKHCIFCFSLVFNKSIDKQINLLVILLLLLKIT